MKHLRTRGFTLVETLFAILVLSVAIVGPLTIASRGLNAALMAKNKTIAIYLAQDAVEYVRYQRDTNRLNNTLWLTGLDDPTQYGCVSSDGTKACTIDSINDKVAPCASTGCLPLNYSTVSNAYTYGASADIIPTIFTRTVSITTPVGTNAFEAAVQVTVSWNDVGSVLHTVTLQENLLDWQPTS